VQQAIDRGYGVTHVYPSALRWFPWLLPSTTTPWLPCNQPKNHCGIVPPVPAVVNTDTIAGVLKNFGLTTVEPISGSDWDHLWDDGGGNRASL
jgi:hypothetical protein